MKRELAPKNDRKDKKLDLSLLPMDVIGEELVMAYIEGICKYERDSWRKGFSYSQMIAGARRHIDSFWDKGEDYDPEAVRQWNIPKHHLAGALFCLISILFMQREGMDDLDDRFKKTEEKDLVYGSFDKSKFLGKN